MKPPRSRKLLWWKIAQERLGHSTITTTLDLYSHVTDSMQIDAAERLDAAWRRR